MSSDHQSLENQEDTTVNKTVVPGKEKKEKKSSAKADLFQLFLNDLEKESSPEVKIQKAISFMKDALAQSGSPRFKDFWEARKVCLPLFKEAIPPAQRASLWNEYIEISSEARRLKEILDEQTAYSIEQIELAIKAVKEDLENHHQVGETSLEESFFHCLPKSLKDKVEYVDWQKEINFLNTLAARINSLRKELMRTEMRIRVKNKLFEQLSEIGDKIFPRRKELIKNISDKFEVDVKEFLNSNFENLKDTQTPYFVLKDEIKSFQNFAKMVSLNTHAFSETRMHLSNAWDQIKELEKERKKEIAVKKSHFKENESLVKAKIEELTALCEKEGAAVEEISTFADEILSYMRTVELSRESVRELKDAIFAAKKPLMERLNNEKLERQKEAQAKRDARQNEILEVRKEIEELLNNSEGLSKEDLEQKREEFKKKIEALNLSKLERPSFDALFRSIHDLIVEKQREAILNLSADDREALTQLESLLVESINERKAIRNQLEIYRKASGNSGLDFEKAIMYSELVDVEKARLEKVNNAICELEEKIKQLKGA